MRSNTSKLMLVFKVVALTGNLFISMMQPFHRMFLELLFCNCLQKYFGPHSKAVLLLWLKPMSNKNIIEFDHLFLSLDLTGHDSE